MSRPGNISNTQLAARANYELGNYLTAPQKSIIQNALNSTTTGQSLDLSLALEYTTAKAAVDYENFMTGFTKYNRKVAKNSTFWENPSEKITQYSAGLLEQTGRNWEIAFSDDNAPAYMKENAAAGVALDIAVVAPLLKTMRLSRLGKGSTIVDSEVAALERIKLNGLKNQELNRRINGRIAATNNITMDDILLMEKGSRPNPLTYMTQKEIDLHLAKFDDGATRFMTKSNLNKYGPGQNDGTSFVMTKNEADQLIASTKGDKRLLEDALGLPENFLETNNIVRLDIPKPKTLNLRFPSGNEAGVNVLWKPGGRLPNGNLEAVIDIGDVSPNRYTVKAVEVK